MIVWLWDAPGPARCGRGVTDDEGRALGAAVALLRSGAACSATVEAARTVLDPRTLNRVYERTGTGWQARRGEDGVIRWQPLRQARKGAAAGG
jgi:hypothetical protein